MFLFCFISKYDTLFVVKIMKEKFAFLLATLVIGSRVPYFGTVGSLVSLPIVFLSLFVANSYGLYFYFLLSLLILFLGVLSVPVAEKVLGPRMDPHGKVRVKDHNQIGIDETLGMLTTAIPLLFVAEVVWWQYILSFVIFRFFDIVKVYPTKYFDRMQNSWGVMLDDVVAGIYSAFCLYLILSFL